MQYNTSSRYIINVQYNYSRKCFIMNYDERMNNVLAWENYDMKL